MSQKNGFIIMKRKRKIFKLCSQHRKKYPQLLTSTVLTDSHFVGFGTQYTISVDIILTKSMEIGA